jgi:hypothetical protein
VMEEIVNQPGLDASLPSLRDARRRITEVVADDGAWDTTACVGLRLSWSLLLRGSPDRPANWSADDESFLHRALVVVPEDERIVVCHGAPHLGHLVTIEGADFLIDGDQVHPGSQGQDFAYAWLASIRQTPEIDVPACRVLLAVFAGGDARTVFAWAAFFVYEGLVRHSVLRRPFHLAQYRRLWSIVCELIDDVIINR